VNHQDNTIKRMLANPRSAEARLYLDRRHLDKSVNWYEAVQIMEGMCYLERREAEICESSTSQSA
jgi:hypothetical protein